MCRLRECFGVGLHSLQMAVVPRARPGNAVDVAWLAEQDQILDVRDIVGATQVVTEKLMAEPCVYLALDVTGDGKIHYTDVVSMLLTIIGPENNGILASQLAATQEEESGTPPQEETSEEYDTCPTVSVPPKLVSCVQDVNMDGTVSIEDIVLLLNGIIYGSGEKGVVPMEGEKLCLAPSVNMDMVPCRLDTTANELVDIADAVMVINSLIKE
eukprot:scaffold1006_cov408-Prasinococcus_capsulatus_cf.AAC.26